MKVGLFDKIAYALAKRFTKDTIEGAGAVAGKNCTISTIASFLIKSSAVDYEAERAGYEKIIPKNAGARNLVFGGRYLGTAPTAAQLKAISDGAFEGLLLGDYWTSRGINYRIAGFHLRRRKRKEDGVQPPHHPRIKNICGKNAGKVL